MTTTSWLTALTALIMTKVPFAQGTPVSRICTSSFSSTMLSSEAFSESAGVFKWIHLLGPSSYPRAGVQSVHKTQETAFEPKQNRPCSRLRPNADEHLISSLGDVKSSSGILVPYRRQQDMQDESFVLHARITTTDHSCCY